jgi:hypothetical protein
MILRLDPPLPLITPKGSALAYFLIDYGLDYDLMFVCFLDEGGECWTFRGPQVRAVANYSAGRG